VHVRLVTFGPTIAYATSWTGIQSCTLAAPNTRKMHADTIQTKANGYNTQFSQDINFIVTLHFLQNTSHN